MAGARRAFLALAAGWLVFLLDPLSGTGLDFSFCAGAFLITALAGLITLALVLLRRPVSRAGLVVWLCFPLGAAALLTLFLSSQTPANPLFRLRFELSRAALDETARRALAQRPPATPTWIGLFPVHRVDVYPGEVRLMSSACGIVDECGLLYRTGPAPPGRAKTRLRQLDGPWYHLYAVF